MFGKPRAERPTAAGGDDVGTLEGPDRRIVPRRGQLTIRLLELLVSGLRLDLLARVLCAPEMEPGGHNEEFLGWGVGNEKYLSGVKSNLEPKQHEGRCFTPEPPSPN